jgi:hypothetical protein
VGDLPPPPPNKKKERIKKIGEWRFSRLFGQLIAKICSYLKVHKIKTADQNQNTHFQKYTLTSAELDQNTHNFWPIANEEDTNNNRIDDELPLTFFFFFLFFPRVLRFLFVVVPHIHMYICTYFLNRSHSYLYSCWSLCSSGLTVHWLLSPSPLILFVYFFSSPKNLLLHHKISRYFYFTQLLIALHAVYLLYMYIIYVYAFIYACIYVYCIYLNIYSFVYDNQLHIHITYIYYDGFKPRKPWNNIPKLDSQLPSPKLSTTNSVQLPIAKLTYNKCAYIIW